MHDWNVTPRQAAAIQNELRAQVVTKDDLGPVRHVAGVDIGTIPSPSGRSFLPHPDSSVHGRHIASRFARLRENSLDLENVSSRGAHHA